MKHLNCKQCGSNVEVFGDVEDVLIVECEACETYVCTCGSTDHVTQCESTHQKISCKRCDRLLAIDTLFDSSALDKSRDNRHKSAAQKHTHVRNYQRR